MHGLSNEPELRWRLDTVAGRPVLCFAGVLDTSTAPTMTDAVTKTLGDADGLVIDFGDVRVRDPLALTSLITVSHRAGAWPGCRLVLCGVNAGTAGTLRNMGVTRVIHLAYDQASAVRHLAGMGPVPLVRETFLPVLGSIEPARALVRAACESWKIPSASDAAQSVITEFVANAVQHARSSIEVRLTLNGRLLHIAVRDAEAALPVFKDDGEASGLFLVDAFATRWGADRTSAGKVVWATIRVRDWA